MAGSSDLYSPVMSDALVILGAAGIVIPVFNRFRITPVIGFIMVGLLVGPFGLGRHVFDHPWLSMITITDPTGNITRFDGSVRTLREMAARLTQAADERERLQRARATLAAKARVTGRIVQLPASDAAEIEHHLAALRQAGITPEDVEIRRADLEDVFLQVMGANTPPAEAA